MAKSIGLLEQIETGAIDAATPLAEMLRKCVALGGRANSSELRDWARKELDGYGGQEDLPDYRIVPSPILIDGVTPGAIITGQQLPPSSIPDYAAEVITPNAPLTMGIAALERMASDSGTIQLQAAGMADLVRLMNHDNRDSYDTITKMYWGVAPSAVGGVVDHVRTSLVALVAEIRATGVTHEGGVSAEVATQAVNVVIHNQKRSPVVINNAIASGSATASIAAKSEPERSKIPGWIRGPWTVAVGLAGIVGAIAGVGGAFAAGWRPF